MVGVSGFVITGSVITGMCCCVAFVVGVVVVVGIDVGVRVGVGVGIDIGVDVVVGVAVGVGIGVAGAVGVGIGVVVGVGVDGSRLRFVGKHPPAHMLHIIWLSPTLHRSCVNLEQSPGCSQGNNFFPLCRQPGYEHDGFFLELDDLLRACLAITLCNRFLSLSNSLLLTRPAESSYLLSTHAESASRLSLSNSC